MEVRIYYEDTDCGGVVYYANYLKYFERARTEYLESRGCSVAALMEQGTVFVVVHAEVDYRSPARYGETLVIETVVSDLTAASFTCSHVIRERDSRRVVVEGSARRRRGSRRSPADGAARPAGPAAGNEQTEADWTFNPIRRDRLTSRVSPLPARNSPEAAAASSARKLVVPTAITLRPAVCAAWIASTVCCGSE